MGLRKTLPAPLIFNQSPQCPEVPFDGLGTSLCDLVPDNLHYQEEVITRGLHQTREFLSNIPNPGPREAADFPVGWVRFGSLRLDRAFASSKSSCSGRVVTVHTD